MVGSAEQRQDILGRFRCQAGVRCRADFLMKRNGVPDSLPTAHDGSAEGRVQGPPWREKPSFRFLARMGSVIWRW